MGNLLFRVGDGTDVDVYFLYKQRDANLPFLSMMQ